MKYYDVFNGDADGICALHQLRLAEPRPAELISGVKRDIRLLSRIAEVRQASITVLDISMEANKEALRQLLTTCRVFYADHHFAGDIPPSAALEAHIDPRPETCTGLIVDRLLDGRFRPWAVAAAFGDNLHDSARQAARSLSLPEERIAELRELGELLNYNGYGRSEEDLHFPPRDLYRAVHAFTDPFAFFHESGVMAKLRAGYQSDMAKARTLNPVHESEQGRVYRSPAEPWARRTAGVFTNEKAREQPGKAHALLMANGDGSYTVSVRAPLTDPQGADALCRRFPTGGGRAAAAGINALPGTHVDEFLHAFEEAFTQ